MKQKNITIALIIILVLFIAVTSYASIPPIKTTVSKSNTISLEKLSHTPSNFLNKKVQITGRLIFSGKNYFLDPDFALTDGTNKFRVTSSLALEIPPMISGSNKGQASVMSTYIDKILTLQGIVRKNNQGFFLEVTKSL